MPMSTTAEKTPTADVTARLAELRAKSESDVDAAAREAWAWIEELGELARSDRAAGEAKLDELFALGRPPQGLDGGTEGILVAALIQPLVDRVAGAITSAWMPWQGKSFDAAAGRGTNRLTGETRWVAKLLWPLYGTRSGSEGERLAFDFETRVEPGMLDPETDVLVIDYAPVDSNPRLIIKAIRDELVEVVPGANLGKILYRRGGGYTNIGFFALRS
jgi:hypothetical protein